MREIRRNERVAINNIYAWDICFGNKAFGIQGATVPGNARNYSLLNVDVVEDEVAKGNIAFVGFDGLGERAAFQIVDPEMREYFFGRKDEPNYFNEEKFKNILKVISKEKFQAALDKEITNRSEAKMANYYLGNMDETELHGWKVSMLKAHTAQF